MTAPDVFDALLHPRPSGYRGRDAPYWATVVRLGLFSPINEGQHEMTTRNDTSSIQILINARDKLIEVLKGGQQALEIVNRKLRELGGG